MKLPEGKYFKTELNFFISPRCNCFLLAHLYTRLMKEMSTGVKLADM